MSRFTVLVVDDDPVVLRVMTEGLGEHGYQVITANEGQEALIKAASERPDLVLLDVMMPGLDGWQTCRLLKAHPPTKHIPVVLLTAKGQMRDMMHGMQVGADSYITKPFVVDDVAAQIDEILGRAKDPASEERK